MGIDVNAASSKTTVVQHGDIRLEPVTAETEYIVRGIYAFAYQGKGTAPRFERGLWDELFAKWRNDRQDVFIVRIDGRPAAYVVVDRSDPVKVIECACMPWCGLSEQQIIGLI